MKKMTLLERNPQSRTLITLFALTLTLAGCGSVDGGNGGNGGNNNGNGGGEIDDIRSSKDRISNPKVSSSKVEKLTKDNADFAFELYGELAKKKSGENFFYSPHSISSALAMTYAGAEGTSESQMKKALHFAMKEKELHHAFNKLDLLLEKRASQTGQEEEGSPFKLNIANSIWGQKNYPFKTPFLDTLAKNYGAGLKAVDFEEKPEPARKAINEWVEKKTENKIKDLLPKGSINNLTRLVLTNAIYFKASWAHKFDKNATKKAQFTTGGGKKVSVDMMSLKEQHGLSYAKGSTWQAVELPYVGNKVSMVVLVPNSGEFANVEKKLSGSWIKTLFGNLGGKAVELQMPKFDFKTKFSVKKMLQTLGMKAPFSAGEADLSDIADAEQLFINDVIHQSFVAVDEKGTEAAAATAVTVGTTSVPKFVNLTVDRPFIFMIRDRETDAVIFTGRVLDPS